MSKKKKIIWVASIIIIISILIYFFATRPKLSDFKMSDKTTEINKLKANNLKVAGWVSVEGTNIDMPIIMTDPGIHVYENLDSDYYSSIYSRPNSSSNHPTIVSHNVRNVSRNPIVGDNTMTGFEQLMSFIYPEFIEKNQYMAYTNRDGKQSLYKIYAVALLKNDQSASYKDTYTEEEQAKYIETSKDESMYDMDVDVQDTDKLLSLMTCTRFYGNTTAYSFRVDARELRENEKQVLTKVKTNNRYKKIEKRMKEGIKNEEA